MKKSLFLPALAAVLFSCETKPKETTVSETIVKTEPASDSASAKVSNAKPDYGYDIKYTEWEIGNPENTITVLNFYKYWDNKEADKVASLFADTVRLRIPEIRKEYVVPNAKIHAVFAENRSAYRQASNEIISAVSLHDKESNEDWVMITTYNKWVETNGKRDSLIYADNWRLKNGKIEFLMSYDKVPSKAFLKGLEPNKK